MELAALAVAGAALLAIGPALVAAIEERRRLTELRTTPAPEEEPDHVLELYPAPFGQTASIFTLGSAAAPVLAGFSVTLIGLVLQVPGHLEFSSLALLALMMAVLLLIGAQQCVMRAQRYYVAPDQWAGWMSLVDVNDTDRRELMREDLQEHLLRHVPWLRAARLTYNAGIVVLLTGVALALVPDVRHFDEIPLGRLFASGAAALGALGEIAWVLHDQFSDEQG